MVGNTKRTTTSDESRITICRRNYLKAAAGIGTGTMLAGCIGGGNNNSSGSSGNNNNSGGGKVNGTTQGSVEELTIGGNWPLTGSNASNGKSMKSGLKLALQHKNESGGIKSLGGAKLKLMAADNQGKQSVGAQAEQKLIRSGAVGIVGCLTSPVTFAATSVAEKEHVPHVIDVAVASKILQSRNMDWVYRIQPPASAMARDYVPGVKSVANQFNIPFKSASIIHVNNSYGQDITNNLEKYLPKGNIKIKEKQAVSLGQSDMNTEITKIKNAGADALIVVNYTTAGVQTFNAMKNINYDPPLITACASGTLTSPSEIEQIGSYVKGGLDTNYALNPNAKATKNIKKDFKNMTGEGISADAAMAYTAGKVLLTAIERAGSNDPAEINQVMNDIKVKKHPLAMGTIEFKKNGENVHNLAPLHQVQDQNHYLVYPKKYASRDPINPRSS